MGNKKERKKEKKAAEVFKAANAATNIQADAKSLQNDDDDDYYPDMLEYNNRGGGSSNDWGKTYSELYDNF